MAISNRIRSVQRAARSAAAFTVLLALGVGVTGCRNSLDDAVGQIARTQAVDTDVVRTALRLTASTEDEQLQLARRWQADLPQQPIPDPSRVWNRLAAEIREQVKNATCAALIDIARKREVPSGEQFVSKYLGDIATQNLPYGEIQQLADTFDELWKDASAGTLTSYDIRLTMMEIQHC